MADANHPARRRPSSSDDFLVRNDGAHRESAAGASHDGSAADDLYDSPAYWLGLRDPRIVEQLERLDDVVFEAIAGKPVAINRLRELWNKVTEIVGPQLADESRHAYLRHALNKWRECVDSEREHNPRLAVALLDVIVVLIGGDDP